MANTILATALPSVAADLSGARDYTAVVTAYLLPKALTTPVGGRLVDTYPPRTVVAVCCVLYFLGALGCALSGSMTQLLCARVVQGIGGGSLLASVYTFLDLVVPPREQGKVQGTVAMILGVGAAIAPVIGGLLTEHLGWRWCFYFNLPPVLLCLVQLFRLPHLEPRGKHRLDVPGVVLLAGVAFPLLLATTWGGSRMSWSSPVILGLFAFALCAMIAFVWFERRLAEPLFDPGLLRDPVMFYSFTAAFCVGGCFLGSLIYLPLFMSVVKGANAFVAGVSLLPFVFGNIVGAVCCGIWVSRGGRYKRPALTGTLLATLVSALMFVVLEHETPTWLYLLLQALLAFAFGLCTEVYSVAVQNVTTAGRQGMTGSFLEFVRQLGSSLGIAFVGSLLLMSLDRQMPELIERYLKPIGLNISVGKFEDESEVKAVGDEIFANLHKEDPATVQRLAALSGAKGQDPRSVADSIQSTLNRSLAEAVQRAQREVAALGFALCLLAFAATWRLPELQLRTELLS